MVGILCIGPLRVSMEGIGQTDGQGAGLLQVDFADILVVIGAAGCGQTI